MFTYLSRIPHSREVHRQRPPPTQVMEMPFHDSSNQSDDESRSAQGEYSRADDSGERYKDARSLHGADGTLWYVHEVSAETMGSSGASLLLVSANQVRRITPVPINWRALSISALLALPFSSL